MQNYDVIIVGDGIGARVLLHEMAKSQFFLDKSILQIHNPTNFPLCSFNTTSVVSGGIHKKGLSPLGDLLVDSYDSFVSFWEKHPHIADRSKQFYIFDENQEQKKKEQFLTRYGDDFASFYGAQAIDKECYIVYPEKLMDCLKENYSKLDITSLEQSVTNLSSHTVHTDSTSFKSSSIILCTGAYTSFLNHDLELSRPGKSVSGSYLLFEDVDLSDSFVLSLGHYNIIYRKSSKQLLFGGTSYEGHIHYNNQRDIRSNFEKVLSFADLERELERDLDISKAKVLTGLRHKCSKRLPVSKEVSDGVFLFSGFYKNGFTFPFELANSLCDDIELRLNRPHS